ncbi:MAG TPA: type II toxin-antitoxin system Y4mF family antitoxin, partial [Dermatophilaceae bacterium]|nr:type II toxin-antitoxin system Y4mF family antitoxin [Dermatophilaceae bacterium]
ARRKDLGLTQVEVAELAGVSDRFVMELEKGKPTVRLDKLTAVLEAMGLTLRAEVRQ